MKLASYAELHCISNYSFLRGGSFPEELVERAVKLKYRALAITDECSLAGVVRAHLASKEHKLHLIITARLMVSCHILLPLADAVPPKASINYPAIW